MKKLITLALAMTMLFSLAACGEKTDGGSSTDAAENNAPVTELMDKIMENVPSENLPRMLETIGLESEESYAAGSFAESSGLPFDEAFQFLTGIPYEDGLEAAVNMSMMGSVPYTVVLVRVPSGKDASKVADDLKANNDPAKWICVCADTVETRINGSLVLFAMVNKEENGHGPIIDAIIKNFEAL